MLTARQHQAEGRQREVYVKWKGRSYLHCSWVREGDIEGVARMFAHLRTKLRRFFQGQEEPGDDEDEEEKEGGWRWRAGGTGGP